VYLFWYRDQLTEYAIDSMFEGSMKYQSNKEHKRIQEHPTKSDNYLFSFFFFLLQCFIGYLFSQTDMVFGIHSCGVLGGVRVVRT